MMREGHIDLIKLRRTRPESVQHAKGFIAESGKTLMDHSNWWSGLNRVESQK